jgi:orotate phosphoribosyltransferase-like protein
MRSLRKEGLSTIEIAQRFNVTQPTASYHTKRKSSKRKEHRSTKSELEILKEKYNKAVLLLIKNGLVEVDLDF